jgi:SHS2 domain-containing protein
MDGPGQGVESPGFREVEHTSDRSYRIWGADLGALLESGARALYDLANLGTQVGAPVERSIDVSGLDRESLLIGWLNELLFRMGTDGEAFQQFEFQELSDCHLRARALGVVCSQAPRDVKAATYNGLAIRPSERGLEATVVFDV